MSMLSNQIKAVNSNQKQTITKIQIQQYMDQQFFNDNQ